jgi:hypothetical protein
VGWLLAAQAASKRDAVHAAVMAADPSGEGHLSSEQLEQAFAAAGLKFTRHQVNMLSGWARYRAYKVSHLARLACIWLCACHYAGVRSMNSRNPRLHDF